MRSITEAFTPGVTCQGHCEDGHVCENHPDEPWEHDGCGGAGMPCNDPACNFTAETLEARRQATDAILAVHHPSRLGDSTARAGAWTGPSRRVIPQSEALW